MTKFEIKENNLTGIKICKKIDKDKILIFTYKGIIIIKIIDNNDFIFIQNIDISADIYDFNSNLDLLYFYNTELKLHLFPDYKGIKISFSEEEKEEIEDNKYKIQFINKDKFFLFEKNILKLLLINGNKCKKINEVKIKINIESASIIELNGNYYCFNDDLEILLLNKNNLYVSKIIYNSRQIHKNILGLLKISDKIISVFTHNHGTIELNNYYIYLDGIKWVANEREKLLELKNGEKIKKFVQNKNYILFIKEHEEKWRTRRNHYVKYSYGCNLFEIVKE